MITFTIESNDYLKRNTQGYCHAPYHGGGTWKIPGTIENMLCTLKNDITRYGTLTLNNACKSLSEILKGDIKEIVNKLDLTDIVICTIPRSKAESTYRSDQLLFKKTVSDAIKDISWCIDGTNYIKRIRDTKTTHRAKWGFGGNGEMPYPGITKDTCSINKELIKGKNVLLIDDIYTRTINIDEDGIQALLDNGAKNVYFYAVGKTTF